MDLVQKYFSLVVWNKVDVESDSLESAIFYIFHRCKLFMNNQKKICVISTRPKRDDDWPIRVYQNFFAKNYDGWFQTVWMAITKKRDEHIKTVLQLLFFWRPKKKMMCDFENKRYEHILNPWINSSHFQKVWVFLIIIKKL